MFVNVGGVVVLDDIKSVADGAAWVRNERARRGWTAKCVAEKITDIARSVGDDLSLTQQAISFFETGKAKSLPRWLRYFDLVLLADGVNERVSLYSASDDDIDDDALTSEEQELIDLFRLMEEKQREATLTVARSFAGSARPPTFHDVGLEYHAEGGNQRKSGGKGKHG